MSPTKELSPQLSRMDPKADGPPDSTSLSSSYSACNSLPFTYLEKSVSIGTEQTNIYILSKPHHLPNSWSVPSRCLACQAAIVLHMQESCRRDLDP